MKLKLLELTIYLYLLFTTIITISTSLYNMSIDPQEDNCSICYNLITSNKFKALSCTHIYHTKCIHEWLKNNNSCPMCRSTSIKKVDNIKDVRMYINFILMLLYIIGTSWLSIKVITSTTHSGYSEKFDLQKINTCARIEKCNMYDGNNNYSKKSTCQYYSLNLTPNCTRECVRFNGVSGEKIGCSLHSECEPWNYKVTYEDPECPINLKKSWLKKYELNDKEILLYWTGFKPI